MKWTELFEVLQKRLRDGAYPPGVPLPSENSLVGRYGVSRITVARAMDELRRKGLVWRKRGSGTFATASACREGGRLGLIMPSLASGEVFPPICQALVRFAQKDGFSLLLGDMPAEDTQASADRLDDLVRTYVAQKVVGVIFQPLALLQSSDDVTARALALLDGAGIRVVLIDRDFRMPGLKYDFVGIDNFTAGRDIGEHLVARGARRVAFLMRPRSPTVIRDRYDGVMSAVGPRRAKNDLIVANPSDVRTLSGLFRGKSRPDAVVCESDYVALCFRNTLSQLGLSVPKDVRLVGFNDGRYAAASSPPLTTVRQPCEEIALVAYRSLRERLRDPSAPAKRMLLPADLVVRAST